MEHQAQATEKPSQDNKSGKQMQVKVHAPYKVYFDGTADSISAVNETGPFDVLGKHHNFMTLLDPCDLIIRHGEEQEKFSISKGVMHVKQNEVIVFLDV